MKLLFIRHGDPDYTIDSLTEKGWKEAEFLSEKMASLADYVEQVRTWVEEVPVPQKADPVLQEEIVDRITRSIRQTAATGSHFSKMLSPEEEEIMREIIREFMNAE